jgi:RNA polymerase primary sigma factor
MAEHTDSVVKMWMSRAGKTPLLSAFEELELGRKIRDENDELSRTKLIESNLRLVISVAKRYMGQGNDFSDLVQNGNLGLVRAAERYDYRRGYRFSTYAIYWVRQAITRGLSDSSRAIRLPAYITEMLSMLYKIAGVMVQNLGREPTQDELIQRSGYPADIVSMFLHNVLDPISMNSTPVGNEGEEETLIDFIRDDSIPTTSEVLDQFSLEEQIHDNLFSVLSPREQDVITLRFGLLGRGQHTLEETGPLLGITSERARQIEWQALAKIRNSYRWRRIAQLVTE